MAAANVVEWQFVATGADVIDQVYQRSDKAAEKSAAKQAAAAQKAEKAKIASADKAAKAEESAAKKAEKALEKAREHVFQVRVRYDAQEAASAKKLADVQIRETERVAKARQKAWGVFGGSVGSAFKGAATTAVALGLGTVGVAARQEFALRRETDRIAVMGHKPGEAFVSGGEIAAQVHATAMGAPGVKSDELAAGMKEFVSLTNDLPLAQKHLATLATAMQSMGTDAAGTAKIMVALKQSFGITGVQEMRDAMASLEAQAKASGMPMDALEGHILNLAAAGKRFGMSGAGGAQQIGGLMAMARAGIGDPEKAEKGAGHFMDKLIESAPKLAGMGVTVFDKGGKVKDINSVIGQLIQKVGGNNMALKQVELGKLLGVGERGGLGVIGSPLQTYQKTFQSTQGTEAQKTAAATAAMNDEIKRLTQSTATWADTQANAAQLQQSSGAQLDSAWEAIRAKVGSQVVPALANLVPMITGATNVLDPFIAAVTFGAGVIKEVFDTLVDAGVLKKHEDTPIEKAQKATKALAEFNETHNGLWGQEGEAAQRTKLEKAAADAQEALFPTKQKLPGKGSDEDFAREYAMASGKEGEAYQTQRDIGLKLAKQIHADPNTDTRDPLGTFTNDAQQAVIGGRKEQEIADQSARAFDANAAAMKSHQDAIDAAAAAAKRLADNLDQAGDAAGRSTPLSDRP